uniref:Ovule protein n=1 Tax=Heterorhabditis bacteriophora TaxID=37862 RepID=A0A1I7WIZ2_HETBA
MNVMKACKTKPMAEQHQQQNGSKCSSDIKTLHAEFLTSAAMRQGLV